MTNMQPQYANFNQRGTWYKMEEELRKLAPKIDTDTLFIVKGGTIDAVGSDQATSLCQSISSLQY